MGRYTAVSVVLQQNPIQKSIHQFLLYSHTYAYIARPVAFLVLDVESPRPVMTQTLADFLAAAELSQNSLKMDGSKTVCSNRLSAAT